MDMTLDEAVERLNIVDTYVEKFQKVFGRAICAEDVAKALASYVRTILSGDAPIDQLRVRGDETAMPLAARRGLSLFAVGREVVEVNGLLSRVRANTEAAVARPVVAPVPNVQQPVGRRLHLEVSP